MAQPAHYRQPDAVSFCSIPSSHSPFVQTAVGASICFSCSASFECKGLFQRHDRCCPFSDLAVDLPMPILPETPAMIAGIPTDHLPVFEGSVNAAIRCASVGGSAPPANRPFYQCRFAGERQSVFGTGAAVPIILITTVLQDNIAKTSQDRPYQN
jgi:hypothetical protein